MISLETIKNVLKLLLNISTIVTIITVLVVMSAVIKKRHDLKEEMGISIKTLGLIMVGAEIIYDIGLLFIAYSLGVNIIYYLQNLEFGNIVSAINSVDISRMSYVGISGWLGLLLCASAAYLSPGYLLVKGGKNLTSVIRKLAWTEIGMESLSLGLIFASIFLR